MTALWRCSYAAGMNESETQVWRYDGHVAIENGATAAICHHEAGHTVLRFALGFRCGPTVLQQKFARELDGLLRASSTGVSYPVQKKPLPDIVELPTFEESAVVRAIDDRDLLMCWRPFLRQAIIMCAGHAAERKYRLSQDLPMSALSEGDRIQCENLARNVWDASARDGTAFLRLAWIKTQKFLEIPEIWNAVCAVADELFSGLVINSRPVPLHNDVVQYSLPGHVAEYLIERAGCTFGMLREEHNCIDGTCLRSRPILRQWRMRVIAETELLAAE